MSKDDGDAPKVVNCCGERKPPTRLPPTRPPRPEHMFSMRTVEKLQQRWLEHRGIHVKPDEVPLYVSNVIENLKRIDAAVAFREQQERWTDGTVPTSSKMLSKFERVRLGRLIADVVLDIATVFTVSNSETHDALSMSAVSLVTPLVETPMLVSERGPFFSSDFPSQPTHSERNKKDDRRGNSQARNTPLELPLNSSTVGSETTSEGRGAYHTPANRTNSSSDKGGSARHGGSMYTTAAHTETSSNSEKPNHIPAHLDAGKQQTQIQNGVHHTSGDVASHTRDSPIKNSVVRNEETHIIHAKQAQTTSASQVDSRVSCRGPSTDEHVSVRTDGQQPHTQNGAQARTGYQCPSAAMDNNTNNNNGGSDILLPCPQFIQEYLVPEMRPVLRSTAALERAYAGGGSGKPWSVGSARSGSTMHFKPVQSMCSVAESSNCHVMPAVPPLHRYAVDVPRVQEFIRSLQQACQLEFTATEFASLNLKYAIPGIREQDRSESIRLAMFANGCYQCHAPAITNANGTGAVNSSVGCAADGDCGGRLKTADHSTSEGECSHGAMPFTIVAAPPESAAPSHLPATQRHSKCIPQMDGCATWLTDAPPMRTASIATTTGGTAIMEGSLGGGVSPVAAADLRPSIASWKKKNHADALESEEGMLSTRNAAHWGDVSESKQQSTSGSTTESVAQRSSGQKRTPHSGSQVMSPRSMKTNSPIASASPHGNVFFAGDGDSSSTNEMYAPAQLSQFSAGAHSDTFASNVTVRDITNPAAPSYVNRVSSLALLPNGLHTPVTKDTFEVFLLLVEAKLREVDRETRGSLSLPRGVLFKGDGTSMM